VVLTTAAAALLGSSVPARAAAPGWRQVYNHHWGAAANNSAYLAGLALSANDAWVLGGSNLGGGGYAPTGTPVAAHWNGKAWGGDALPKQATGYVVAASATSPSDIWAVTEYSAYVLHFNGRHWSVPAHLPDTFEQVTGITAISPADAWVFGGGGAIGGIGTWHYDGKTWQKSQGGTAQGLEYASAISSKDIWGVGGRLSPASAIVRFNGKTWQPVTAKALSGLQFEAIAAFSDKDVWAQIASPVAGTAPGLIHYNGKMWARFTLPFKVHVGVPVPDGHGGLWFTGFTGTGQRYIIHRSAAGKWTRTAIPAFVTGAIAHIPGTASAWAFGHKAAGPGNDAVIWADGEV
jgi:hypothetical protein